MAGMSHYTEWLDERYRRITDAIQQAAKAQTDEEKIEAGERIEDVLEDAMNEAAQ